MATTYQTVSEEMAGTDWSVSTPRAPRVSDTATRPNLIGIAIAAVASLVAILGVIYLLPPGSY